MKTVTYLKPVETSAIAERTMFLPIAQAFEETETDDLGRVREVAS